jgi:hypothetical protein
MEVPESKEVLIEKVANDPRVLDYLARVSTGLEYPDFNYEFILQGAVISDYGIDYETFDEAAERSREITDEAILEGKIGF